VQLFLPAWERRREVYCSPGFSVGIEVEASKTPGDEAHLSLVQADNNVPKTPRYMLRQRPNTSLGVSPKPFLHLLLEVKGMLMLQRTA
jgi:hypothetical protein